MIQPRRKGRLIAAYKRHTSPRAGSYAHDTQHEKIIRGVAIGMALIMCVLNPPNPGRGRLPVASRLGRRLGAPMGGSRSAWRRGRDAVGTRSGAPTAVADRFKPINRKARSFGVP